MNKSQIFLFIVLYCISIVKLKLFWTYISIPIRQVVSRKTQRQNFKTLTYPLDLITSAAEALYLLDIHISRAVNIYCKGFQKVLHQEKPLGVAYWYLTVCFKRDLRNCEPIL